MIFVSSLLRAETNPLAPLFTALQHYRLDNGLSVVLAPKKDINTVTVRWSVQVGAVDEQNGESGFAHLFEHMMFKGTPNIGDSGYYTILNQIGGIANAITNFDVTTFYATFPPHALQQVLWLEADRLQHLEMTSPKLKNQVAAVLEEKAMNLDNQPYFSALAAYVRRIANGTGYEGLVISLEQDLTKATTGSVQRFYDQYYHPKNIILTIFGNFDPAPAKDWINHYFGGWQKQGEANVRNIPDPELKLPASPETLYDRLAPYPAFLLAWLQPGTTRSAHPANQVIANILITGKNSLLKQRLKRDNNYFFDIGFSLGSDKLSIPAIAIVPRSFASLTDILTPVLQLLSTPPDELITRQVLKNALLDMKFQYMENMENPSEISNMITEGVRLYNDPRALFEQQQQIQSLGLEAIKENWNLYWQHPDLVLEVTGDWKIRWGKSMMQLIPKGMAAWLEDCFL